MRRRDVRALRQQSEEWRWSAPLVLDGEEDREEPEERRCWLCGEPVSAVCTHQKPWECPQP